MSERKKRELLWPWTIREFAVVLPVLYIMPGGGIKSGSGGSPLGLAVLVVVAMATCLWYRAKVR
jgi:hypothetical protein